MLSFVMLNVTYKPSMLSVVMLNVVMLSAVAQMWVCLIKLQGYGLQAGWPDEEILDTPWDFLKSPKKWRLFGLLFV